MHVAREAGVKLTVSRAEVEIVKFDEFKYQTAKKGKEESAGRMYMDVLPTSPIC